MPRENCKKAAELISGCPRLEIFSYSITRPYPRRRADTVVPVRSNRVRQPPIAELALAPR
jgi:hypothetical protein